MRRLRLIQKAEIGSYKEACEEVSACTGALPESISPRTIGEVRCSMKLVGGLHSPGVRTDLMH